MNTTYNLKSIEQALNTLRSLCNDLPNCSSCPCYVISVGKCGITDLAPGNWDITPAPTENIHRFLK